MDNSFNKFKKKIFQEIIIKSCVIAVCLSLITFSIPYLYIKIKEIEMNVLYLIFIALSVFIITFCGIYFILKPSKMKVAKRLDNEFSLNEKVQTMIEYENEDDFIINLQRESTLEILSNISIKKLSMRFSLIFFLLIFIACVTSVTALAYPKNEDVDPEPGPEVVEPPFELDNWTKKALYDLIQVVSSSDMDESLKEKYVDKLNSLLLMLEDIDKEVDMIDAVLDTILYVKTELNNVNTNVEIYNAFIEKIENATTYKLIQQIYALSTDGIINALDNFIVGIVASNDGINNLINDYRNALSMVQINSETHELFRALNKFLEAIESSKNLTNPSDTITITQNIYAAIELGKEEIIPVVEKQRKNYDIAVYIEEQLIIIFGLEDEIEVNPGNGNQNSQITPEIKEDPEDVTNPGGFGTGDSQYGSNDLFFDPDTGEIKEYWNYLPSYYSDLKKDIESGVISESIKNMYLEYFDILYGNNDKDS